MIVHNIEDFCNSGIYKHVKAIEPQNNMPNEQLIRYVHRTFYEPFQNVFTTLKDAHVFKINNGSVDIPVGKTAEYDGIYDIWLRDCVGVTQLSVCFNGVEIPIQPFELDRDIAIQIPLAFKPIKASIHDSRSSEVKHIFANSTNAILPMYQQNEVSFIPCLALANDKLTIKVNESAMCDVHISTVYYNDNRFRQKLMGRKTMFFVNGKPFFAYKGVVSR